MRLASGTSAFRSAICCWGRAEPVKARVLPAHVRAQPDGVALGRGEIDKRVKYVAEANALAEQPAFYNSITTNCTTAVVKLIRLAGGTLPFDWRLIVNGYLPGYLYDKGSVVTTIPLSELMGLARIDERAKGADQSPDFPRLIRVGVPSPLYQTAQ